MFSDVEIWTSAFIWRLIGSERNIGQMVTAGMSFPRQLDLLASLFRHRSPDPSLVKPLEVLIKRISSRSGRRVDHPASVSTLARVEWLANLRNLKKAVLSILVFRVFGAVTPIVALGLLLSLRLSGTAFARRLR